MQGAVLWQFLTGLLSDLSNGTDTMYLNLFKLYLTMLSVL
jgi:hypothetical protein